MRGQPIQEESQQKTRFIGPVVAQSPKERISGSESDVESASGRTHQEET